MPELPCAHDANSNLMDASQIKFYNDVDDDVPLSTAGKRT